ncbi:MAG: PD-(D/E)XK nuclease family protein [Minisyncoccia bacterium]
MKTKENIIKLSPSGLNLFLECPHCFWLQYNLKINRPQPPASTLPNGVDLSLKKYFDNWRQQNKLPPLLRDKLNVDAKFVSDLNLITQFRSHSFQWYDSEFDAYLFGILDDALELENKFIVPLDNKTKGFPPKEINEAYKIQMSTYTLLLRQNNFATKNFAYIVYWYFDHKNIDLENPLQFNVSVEKIDTNPDMILDIFRKAVTVLREEMPNSSSTCQFCNFRYNHHDH